MSVLTDIRNNLLRYTTDAYIAENSIVVTLQRKTLVAKPGGGHDKTPVLLPPQTFRIVNQTVGSGIENAADGGQVRVDNYILIAPYNADIEPDDSWDEDFSINSTFPYSLPYTFMTEKIHYHVDGLLPNNGYEIRALVTGFAREPQHG